jgi:hypothetical protein
VTFEYVSQLSSCGKRIRAGNPACPALIQTQNIGLLVNFVPITYPAVSKPVFLRLTLCNYEPQKKRLTKVPSGHRLRSIPP